MTASDQALTSAVFELLMPDDMEQKSAIGPSTTRVGRKRLMLKDTTPEANLQWSVDYEHGPVCMNIVIDVSPKADSQAR